MEHLVKTWKGDDSMCGQLSLAMATGQAVGTIVNLAGTHGVVAVSKLEDIAAKLGFSAQPMKEARGKGIVILQNHSRTLGHAMAYEDGVFYDPDGGTFDNIEAVRKFFGNHKWEITKILQMKPVFTREWEVGKR